MSGTEHHQKNKAFTRDVISIIAIIIALMIFVLLPAHSRAASLTFSPESIGIAVTPGDERVISCTVEFSEVARTTSTANFMIGLAGGIIPPTWISPSDMTTLSGSQTATNIPITIKVPADATPGTYTGTLRPLALRSTERVTSGLLSLFVEVMPKMACGTPPLISQVAAGESIVRASNNKPLTFSFTGNISSPSGCNTGKAWYTLADEYGELDESNPLELDDAGNFNISVAVNGSRKGSDKDGRLYTVTFGAENEAGLAIGGEQRIIISHDSRK